MLLKSPKFNCGLSKTLRTARGRLPLRRCDKGQLSGRISPLRAARLFSLGTFDRGSAPLSELIASSSNRFLFVIFLLSIGTLLVFPSTDVDTSRCRKHDTPSVTSPGEGVIQSEHENPSTFVTAQKGEQAFLCRDIHLAQRATLHMHRKVPIGPLFSSGNSQLAQGLAKRQAVPGFRWSPEGLTKGFRRGVRRRGNKLHQRQLAARADPFAGKVTGKHSITASGGSDSGGGSRRAGTVKSFASASQDAMVTEPEESGQLEEEMVGAQQPSYTLPNIDDTMQTTAGVPKSEDPNTPSSMPPPESPIDDSIATEIDLNPASLSLQGDFNDDNAVDSEDFDLWEEAFGQSAVPGTGSDEDGDGFISGFDFLAWQRNFGATTPSGDPTIPEPSTVLLTACLVLTLMSSRRCVRSISFA